MKFVAVTLLALIAAVCAAPTSISDNNIGDIVNVDINAKLDISSVIDQNIVNVIIAYLNQQGIIIAPDFPGLPDLPEPILPPQPAQSAQMLEKLKQLLKKE